MVCLRGERRLDHEAVGAFHELVEGHRPHRFVIAVAVGLPALATAAALITRTRPALARRPL
ncbi:hypothetical protein [Nonomuraea deserti]|uniref:hypothetical protein n=1 Tax=Nonomuraea deserti TaxID=1848322 RepID=UPI0014046852|nr:hypothetical protein [Nonomuraea deserti]